jgi:uncharacterized heparinase superfamily protein
LNTIKYYKISQIYFRIHFKLKKIILDKVKTKKRYLKLLKKHFKEDIKYINNIYICSINIDNKIKNEPFYHRIVITTKEILEKNEFVFLNLKVKFNNEVNWINCYPSKLWGYNLNYFDFLISIAIYINIEQDIKKWEKGNILIKNWIQTYDFKHSVISCPYVVSLRLFNFFYYILLTNQIKKSDLISSSKIIRYMYMDFLHLANNLELDIKGNHLIKNLKSLIILGYFFNNKNSVRIAQDSIRILLKQLDEQILEDGGHFERSTMYHVIVTQDFLEISYFLKLLDIPVPDRFEAKLILMLDFLEVIIHPDGDIGLFNDSAFKIAAKASDILFAGAQLLGKAPSIYARPGIISYLLSCTTKNFNNKLCSLKRNRFDARPYTGYCALSNAYGKMIFDCGDLAPDYLPAHAHNDMLSFEFSIKDRRYIVDTGVYEYEPGILRDKSRSTLSHNTVAVNGAEQSELWSSFRMARRGRIIRCDWKQGNEYNIVSASRSQYNSKITIHMRTILEHEDGFWIVLDNVRATGELPHYSHLHFHPELNPVVTQEDIIADQLFIKPFSIDSSYDVNIFKSLYFPEFGLKQERTSICICTHAKIFGYLLVAYPIDNFKIVLKENNIHLSLDYRDYDLDLQPLFKNDGKE